jgi:hypothetical protein
MNSVRLQDLRNRLSCSHCGGIKNNITVADGLCLAARASLSSSLVNSKPYDVDETIICSNDIDDSYRCIIVIKEQRVRIRSWIKSKDKVIDEALFAGGVCELLFRQKLIHGHYSSEKPVSLVTTYLVKDLDSYPMNHFIEFIHDIASEMTVHQGLLKSTTKVVEALKRWHEGEDCIIHNNTSDHRLLYVFEVYFPTLAKLINSVPTLRRMPPYMAPIIERIICICQYYNNYFDNKEKVLSSSRDFSTSASEDLKRGIIMCTESKDDENNYYRKVPLFEKATKTTHCSSVFNTKNMNKKLRRAVAAGKDTKNYTKQPTCVTMHCICGFFTSAFLLPLPESVGTMFHIMATRFESLNKILIYDNGCNLIEFCDSRLPCDFQGLKVFIDRLHSKGHVACTAGMHLGNLINSVVLTGIYRASCR